MAFDTEQFRVVPEHVLLLHGACVTWHYAEFGAPTIDPKRPYGNSNVVLDIGKRIGVPPDQPDNADEPYSAGLRNRLIALHRQTELALQVFLQTGQMSPGLYERKRYTGSWARVGD